MEKLKKILLGVGVVVFIAVFVIWMAGSDLEHIEDTNGPDNYSLQQITDYNIINMDIGAMNVKEETTLLSDLLLYSSDKFTGVHEIFLENIKGNRFDITLYNLIVEKGNFKAVLIHNDEIVHEFTNNEIMQSYTLENPNGAVALRIAGESAEFKFSYDLI